MGDDPHTALAKEQFCATCCAHPGRPCTFTHFDERSGTHIQQIVSFLHKARWNVIEHGYRTTGGPK